MSFSILPIIMMLLGSGGGMNELLDVADPQNRYVLGPDDRIGILVHNQQELSAELDITREGWITAPLIGQIKRRSAHTFHATGNHNISITQTNGLNTQDDGLHA